MRMWMAAMFLLAVSCRPKEENPVERDQKACEKIAALAGAHPTAAEKDRCLFEIGTLGPNMRVCVDACLRDKKTEADFKDCTNECKGGPPYPAFMVCQKITTEGQAFDACEKRHSALTTSNPAIYKCWSRCGERAKDGPAAAACDATCNVPP